MRLIAQAAMRGGSLLGCATLALCGALATAACATEKVPASASASATDPGPSATPQETLEAARRFRTARQNPADEATAWSWLTRAAKGGYAPALMEIDLWCQQAPVWPACETLARDALLRAAQADYAPAQLRLALRLWNPTSEATRWNFDLWQKLYARHPKTPGLNGDRPAAARWMSKAAKAGNGLALYNIGILLQEQNERAQYFKPQYGEAPLATVRTCFYRAALQGIPHAMMALVLTLQHGDADDIFAPAEREALVDYWVGKAGETGAFEKNSSWAFLYSDWRSKIGSPRPDYVARGMGADAQCAIVPLPNAKLTFD
jgi:TPR repeat protein